MRTAPPPHILYQNGDSIPLTIAESKNDFAHLVKNCPRDAREFRPLVPRLSHETCSSSSGTDDQVPIQLICPLIALQVTIFPNSGISICIAYRRMVGDGRTMNHFIKSWASIFKSKNDLSHLVPPFHDRAAVIKDPNGLLPILFNQMCRIGISWDGFATVTATTTTAAALQDKLHATFVLGRGDVDKLRRWITSQFNNINEPPPLLHVSTFVVTCAFIWTCLVKTESVVAQAQNSDSFSSEDDFFHHFAFMVDCTDRAELQVPKTYFGNCLTFCVTSVRKSELLGKNGLFMAAKAIMKEVKDLRENGLLRKVERWLIEGGEAYASGHLVSVAGSPKLRVYETDFGWGRPKKSEVVHIDRSAGSISLTESRDEEGGVEIGLALNKVGMEAFISIFELYLKNHSC